MGASEILQVLETGDSLTSFEIAKKVDIGIPSVRQTIKRLIKDTSEKIEFRILSQEEKIKKYGHGVGCKVYIYWIDK